MKRVSKENVEFAESLLKTLKDLIELREESKEQEQDDTDEKEILKSLKDDYDAFFKWALNLEDNESLCAENAKKRWKELHPNLPLPRVCYVEEKLVGNSFTLLFIMDAFSLYLKNI
jgi:hypothetical protein